MKVAPYVFEWKGRSKAAEMAEHCGLFPLTRAIPKVARITRCRRLEARQALLATGPACWYPTGKYGRRTDYYSVERAVEHLGGPASEPIHLPRFLLVFRTQRLTERTGPIVTAAKYYSPARQESFNRLWYKTQAAYCEMF